MGRWVVGSLGMAVIVDRERSSLGGDMGRLAHAKHANARHNGYILLGYERRATTMRNTPALFTIILGVLMLGLALLMTFGVLLEFSVANAIYASISWVATIGLIWTGKLLYRAP